MWFNVDTKELIKKITTTVLRLERRRVRKKELGVSSNTVGSSRKLLKDKKETYY